MFGQTFRASARSTLYARPAVRRPGPQGIGWTLVPATEFPRHEAAWTALTEAHSSPLLLDFAFVDIARRTFAQGNEVLGICKERGVVTAMGLFTPRSPFVWHSFQPANAPLGAWLSHPRDTPDHYVGQMMPRLPGIAMLVGITQQDPEILPRPSGSACTRLLDYISTPRLTVSGSFDAYWKARGKNLRHNIQRQHNRLKREHLAARLELVTEPARMSSAVRDYACLESGGWKGRENTAVTPDGRQAGFYISVLEHFARHGQACVWRYFIGSRLAASNICIGRDGTWIVLKTAYEEDLRSYSPAQLMNYEAFRLLFEDGRTRRIEFYGPVKDWHSKWTDEVRTLYHLNVYRWRWVPALLARAGKS